MRFYSQIGCPFDENLVKYRCNIGNLVVKLSNKLSMLRRKFVRSKLQRGRINYGTNRETRLIKCLFYNLWKNIFWTKAKKKLLASKQYPFHKVFLCLDRGKTVNSKFNAVLWKIVKCDVQNDFIFKITRRSPSCF